MKQPTLLLPTTQTDQRVGTTDQWLPAWIALSGGPQRRCSMDRQGWPPPSRGVVVLLSTTLTYLCVCVCETERKRGQDKPPMPTRRTIQPTLPTETEGGNQSKTRLFWEVPDRCVLVLVVLFSRRREMMSPSCACWLTSSIEYPGFLPNQSSMTRESFSVHAVRRLHVMGFGGSVSPVCSVTDIRSYTATTSVSTVR